MNNLDATYRNVARSWQPDELAERYQAGYLRGASDIPSNQEPPERPIGLLATAVPRLISLAVAANVLHVLPSAATRTELADQLLSTLDRTAAGGLHRGQQALEADGRARGYDADEWLPLVYEQAADWLTHASPTAEPPSLIEHAQQAGRFAALAIGSLDRDAPSVPEAIADCLAHLLFTCVFADEAGNRRPSPANR